MFGLGSALASALRKVVDALPESHRGTATDAAQRFLIDLKADLLSRRLVTEELPDTAMIEVRRALLAGHKLRIRYAATDQAPQWRTVDPIGLVTTSRCPNGDVYAESMATGAIITGRRTFELAGRWNGDHHDGVPILVLTTHVDDDDVPPGSARFYTDVVSCAVDARAAAGTQAVMVHGAGAGQALLRAGELDEIDVHVDATHLRCRVNREA